jgi:hypothetical protein
MDPDYYPDRVVERVDNQPEAIIATIPYALTGASEKNDRIDTLVLDIPNGVLKNDDPPNRIVDATWDDAPPKPMQDGT